MAVSAATRVGGSIPKAQAELTQALQQSGVEIVNQTWREEPLGGGEWLVSATVELRHAGSAFLPAMNTRFSDQAIKE